MRPGDPGQEFWARQARQLVVINAIQQLMNDEPDRFTGLLANGSARVTLYVVDQSVTGEARLVELLDDARTEGIDVDIAQGLRPLRELNRINEEVLQVFRSGRLERRGVRAAGFAIDTPTGTVQVSVAATAVDVVREAFARYGEAVVVTPVSADSRVELHRYQGSREGWPVPTLAPDDAIGRASDIVIERYRREGFVVEVHHVGDPGGLDADLVYNRIRLVVDGGRVVDATQG